ncbi:LacI family transcriptional regulator [Xylanibacillus composti]|nr:LacI family DNA-binding transcriptional regulator [Xylanibacillus composti]MDT9724026.1 LacI family transcriptional regulator [Xylanibacillus composti]
MKPTIRDVANMAGVSISTVSRVMNAPQTVVESKRLRVLEAIEKLKYQPNGFARGLIYKKSNTIGVMIPDIESMYYAGLIRGMQDAAVQLNCSLMFCNTDRDKDRLLSYIENFYEKQVDGIIFASDALHPAYYEKMTRFHFPFVLASTHSLDYDIPSVDIDDESAAYAAVDYLAREGHRQIGMISFPFGAMISGQPRYDGFVRALRDHGLEACAAHVEFAEHRYEHAYQASRRLLEKAPNLTAVFAASDEFAMGAITAIQDGGRSVPDDVSVIGFDNIRMADMYIPKLSTVAQPVYEIGIRAIQKLHELITDGSVKQLREKLPHKLIIRDSSKPLR